jgi:serine/threonine-protein kinase
VDATATHPDLFDEAPTRLWTDDLDAPESGTSPLELAPTEEQAVSPFDEQTIADRPEDQMFDEITSLLPPGSELGSYVIGPRLAKGGMGVVYGAAHRHLHRDVAIKLLRHSRRANPDIVKRFLREAVAATRVRHPGVVQIIDYDHAPDGAAFLVMERLDGVSLGERLEDRGRLEVHEALRIARGIADATAAIHAEGIVHRDLKPENVFLVPGTDADAEQVKVLDFGVAKFLGARDVERSRQGRVVGTPHYMSPEQCRGRPDIDHRSDIYSLGCLLYEMLSGSCPFRGDVAEILGAHVGRAPPILSSVAREVPPALDELLARMLAKDPARRLPSMAQVVAELLLLERAIEQPPAAVAHRRGRGALAEISSRPRIVAALLAVPVILLLLAALG